MKRIMLCAVALCMITGCLTACDRDNESSSEISELIVSGGASTSLPEEESSPFPVEIGGIEIKSERNAAVSLSPAVTEIIADLGYADRLVGVSRYCDCPESITAETVGSSENPDLKAIEQLKPDVVITISKPSERDVYAMEDMGAAVVCLDMPDSAEQLAALYGDIAAVFGGVEKMTAETEKALKTLKEAADGAFSGSFIYVTPKKTIAGAGTIENGILSLCGSNLCTEESYQELSVLTETAPDIIIAADTLTEADLTENEMISAYVSGGAMVAFVPASLFERPTLGVTEVFSAIKGSSAE